MHKDKFKDSNGHLVYANDTYKVYQIKDGFATIRNFSYVIVDCASKQAGCCG